MADSSRAILRYAEETTWGTTPTASGTILRITGESLKTDTEHIVSSEISSDREIPSVVRAGNSSSGGFDFELVYGNLDELLEGALASDWSLDTPASGTDTLVNGTTNKSYTLEKEFDDQTIYISYNGCRVDSLSLSFTPGQIVTGSIGFMGEAGTSAVSTVFTGSTGANTNTPANAVDNITAVNEGGSSITGVMGFSIDVANNLRLQREIGTLGPRGIGYGRFVVTGTLRVYFESRTLFDKYLNDTVSQFDFTVTDAGSNVYTFTLPELKYVDGTVVAGGNDQDVIADLSFQAYKDPATNNTLKITRA